MRIFLTFLCLLYPLWSDGPVPISFSAGYQEYNQAAGFVVLKDHASILGHDFQIDANNLQYNLNTGDIAAQGNVRLIRGEDILNADSLLYNVRTREGRVEEFKAVLENTFVVGQSAILMPTSMQLNKGYATTCEENNCHYKIMADEMVLLDQEALFLKGARFYIGNTRLFSLPAYKLKINKDSQLSAPLFIIPGYDSSRGVHARIRSNFFVNDNLYGTLGVTPTSRQGLEWDAEIEAFQQTKHPGRLTLDMQRDEFVRTETLRTTWDQRFEATEDSYGTLRLDYLRDAFDVGSANEELNYSVVWKHRFDSGFALSGEYQARYDLDKGDYILDNRVQSFEKRPEIRLDSPTRRLGISPFQMRYGTKFANYSEKSFTSRVDSEDRELWVNFIQDTVQWGRTRFDFNVLGRYNDYSVGGERRFVRLNAGLIQDLGSGLTYVSRFNLNDTHGNSPWTSYDRLTDQKRLTHRLHLRRDQYSATLFQAAYDYKTGFWNGASSAVSYRSVWNGRPWAFGVQAGYDLGAVPDDVFDLSLDRTSFNFTLRETGQWSFDLRGQYDWGGNTWESFTQMAEFYVHPKVFVTTQNHYNALTEEFTRVKLGLVRDWDCLEGRLDWDFKQEELTIQVYLKQGTGQGLGFRIGYEAALSVKPQLPGIDEPL